jgi:methionine-gamma-lyase
MKKGFESICVKDPIIENHASHVPPIYATSTFAYEDIDAAFAFFRGESDRFTYSRLGNPSVQFVADKIAALEGYDDKLPVETFGMLFGSGMGAIAASLLACLKNGEAVLTQPNLYGTTNELMISPLRSFGIDTVYADLKNLDEVEEKIKSDPKIRVIYIETPANPTLACYDLQALSALAKTYGLKTIVDNTFSTPYFQRPILHGIDIVVHSGTKFLNGHGTGISGALVCTDKKLLKKQVYGVQKMFGAVCSPFESYLLNNGIKTLPLRMQKHESNAKQLAAFLVQHGRVKQVNFLSLINHPDHELAARQMYGFGGMLSFEIDGNMDAGINFLRKIKFLTVTASLGTADTLVAHPASTSHVNVPREQRLSVGIADSLIRVSVGLENIDNILEDFSQALSV